VPSSLAEEAKRILADHRRHQDSLHLMED